MERYVCIHGHFYQPPRENPWLEEIEVQDSAYPYHDWNERITDECYQPNTASRLLNDAGKIGEIFNNYAHMSFNFGPMLLSWMEKSQPEAYARIIDSDRQSRERFSGHGSALAQCYNHLIMPLANSRDKRTQVIWGIRDFKKRFGRDPEGMWLPETAVDTETLDILAEQGISFTILAPWQGTHVRKAGGGEWQELEWGAIDTTAAYRCPLPSGREIALFFYEGSTAYDVSTGSLLTSGDELIRRVLNIFAPEADHPQLAHIANDGESYGHHHKFGDMALSFFLNAIEERGLARLTTYGEFLEKHPPLYEVKIRENSSWSCIHGVERWRSDCGCNSGQFPQWRQRWRKPLRDALDELRDELAPAYEYDVRDYVNDPWAARDDYIEIILDRSRAGSDNYLKQHAARELSDDERTRVLKLLEIQRYAMAMYTSCGWFYDEISGIETVQVMKYAARAIMISGEVFGYSLEPNFLADLEKAPSNYDAHGRATYERLVIPAKIDLSRVVAHYAISSLFRETPEHMKIYNYIVDSASYKRAKTGKTTLAAGIAHAADDFTGEKSIRCFAVLHFGDHNFKAGVRDFEIEKDFEGLNSALFEAFERGDTTDVVRLVEKHFGPASYSLTDLFRDEQRNIIDVLMGATHSGIDDTFRQIYELNSPLMSFFGSVDIPIPRATFIAAKHIVNHDLQRLFAAKGPLDTEKLRRLVSEALKWSIPLDREALAYLVPRWLYEELNSLREDSLNTERMENLVDAAALIEPLGLDMNLWLPQNSYFSLRERCSPALREAEQGDAERRLCAEEFRRMGEVLNIAAV